MKKKLQQIAEKALTNSVVRLVWQKTDEKTGKRLVWPRASGFFVDTNLIVTNIHCIAGASSVFVELVSTETEFPVEGVVAFDAENDLVILKVTGKGVPLSIDDSDTVQIGEVVCGVGYPHGEKGEVTHVTIEGIRHTHKRFQIKETFDPGQSGGAILNSAGEVIGVAVGSGMSVFSGGGLRYSGYTIPASTLGVLLAPIAA